MQVGDYAALRFVNGQLRPSIYREYVNAVTKGLVSYYTAQEELEKSPELAVDDPQAIDPLVDVAVEAENVADSSTPENEIETE